MIYLSNAIIDIYNINYAAIAFTQLCIQHRQGRHLHRLLHPTHPITTNSPLNHIQSTLTTHLRLRTYRRHKKLSDISGSYAKKLEDTGEIDASYKFREYYCYKCSAGEEGM
jgi:hypothetical protein